MLKKNYETIKQELERFSKEYLDNSNGVVELLDGLYKNYPQKIENVKNIDLMSGTLVYIYLKQNGLNGRGGITAKRVGEFFNVKPVAITGKVSDLDYYCKEPTVLIPDDEEYEFYDEVDRYEVSQLYWDFLESRESENIKKSIQTLRKIISKDENYFDPYITLSEYYVANKEYQKAGNILAKGYEKVQELVLNGLRFPDKLEWGYMENRHIIRMYFHYAMFMWEVEEKKLALKIFQRLLKSNTNDNIGARYAIVAMLDGFKSMGEYESKFQSEYGLDAMKIEEWFKTTAKKHKEAIGWWFEAVGEEL